VSEDRLVAVEVTQARHDERLKAVEAGIGRIARGVSTSRNFSIMTILTVLGAILAGIWQLNNGG
jgi:hypothetical protein